MHSGPDPWEGGVEGFGLLGRIEVREAFRYHLFPDRRIARPLTVEETRSIEELGKLESARG